MTKLELLRAVRAQINTPEKWTQNTSARDVGGCPVHPYSVYAASWCVYGASSVVMFKAHDYSADCIMPDLVTFNDEPTTTHADVMERLDTLIADEEARVAGIVQKVHELVDA